MNGTKLSKRQEVISHGFKLIAKKIPRQTKAGTWVTSSAQPEPRGSTGTGKWAVVSVGTGGAKT